MTQISKLGLALSLLFSVATFGMSAQAEGYTFDKGHTHILFEFSHLGFSTSHGRFNTFDGTVSFDPEAPEKTEIGFTIKTDSINTAVDKLDQHLMGADFFNTAEHPEMVFQSTGVTITGDETADLAGDLTIKGITKPIVLKVSLNKMGAHPMKSDVHIAGFDATTMIKRSDFDLGLYAPAVGDDVTINISTELQKRSE